MNFGRKLLNFYLYSNLHIALVATALTLFTYTGLMFSPDSNYLFFVFSSTLLLYAVHRAIGIRQTQDPPKNSRFDIIESYRHHIFFYAFIGFVGSGWCFFKFDKEIQNSLIVPVLFSSLYALPLLGKKRIRDFHYVKIFLVALIWSWITFAIPYLQFMETGVDFVFLFLDRTFFIFAITLAFDIRDIETDQMNKVKTLVHLLGSRKSKILGIMMLFIGSVSLYYIMGFQLYSIALLLTYFIAGCLIAYASQKKSDVYFTGWVDGTMAIPLIVLHLSDLIKLTS